MKLTIVRINYNDKTTIGRLYINNEFFCYTLEDKVRPKGVKVYGETAIPSGKYKVIVSYSPKFKKLLPEILNVPMFSGIRMHGGNSSINSSGCVILAKELIDENNVRGNMTEELIKKLQSKKEEHSIEIVDTKEIK